MPIYGPVKPVDDFCAFLCLNPSTADETNNDPTVTRCIRYAMSWGYSAFCMLNAFAYRATDPDVMKAHPEPIGDMNNHHILEVAEAADIVVAAWGNHGTYLNRQEWLIKKVPKLHYLKLTQEGQPCHPLYLRKTLTPIPF